MPRPNSETAADPAPRERLGALRKGWAALRVMGPRGVWWAVLDLWDRNRRLRLAVYGLAGVAALAGAGAAWVYPKFLDRRAAGAAWAHIEAGRLREARTEVARAIAAAPDRLETWRVAAAFERASGNFALAAARGRVAADLAPEDQEIILGWAADALAAEQEAEARRALARLTPEAVEATAAAQRLLAELAARGGDANAARAHYEAALKLDGPGPLNEVPLGRLLLKTGEPAWRAEGRKLLAPYAIDEERGAVVLRALLDDAMARGDRAEALRLAEALRVQPKRAAADMPVCLGVLAQEDAARFAVVLAELETTHAANPRLALELVEWLNAIGRAAEAARWAETLPEGFGKNAELAAGRAESLRLKGDWATLAGRLEGGDWGAGLEYLRRAYGFEAARRLGDEPKKARWQVSLRDAVANQGGLAYRAATRLWDWGAQEEAAGLATLAAEEPEVAAAALGLLARYHEAARDAVGLCRVFRRLQSLRPQDAAIADRLAYFSALIGQGTLQAKTLARKNVESEPGNLGYRATYGFVMVTQDDARGAVELLGDHAKEGSRSSAFAFAYGLALAGIREREAAQAWLGLLDLAALMPPEAELVQRALGK